jgi:hypothetical protein
VADPRGSRAPTAVALPPPPTCTRAQGERIQVGRIQEAQEVGRQGPSRPHPRAERGGEAGRIHGRRRGGEASRGRLQGERRRRLEK